MDLLTAAYEILFFALFGAAVISYRRRPGPLTLDVALLFGALAGLFAVQLAGAVWPRLPEGLSQVGVALLLAQPGLALRLTRHLRPLPRWVGPLMVVGYLLSVGSSAWAPTSRSRSCWRLATSSSATERRR